MGEVRKLIEDPTFPNGWPVKETHIDHQLKWKDGVSKEYGVHGSAVGVDFDICIADGICITVCPVNVFDRMELPGEQEKMDKGITNDSGNAPLATWKADPARENDCIFCRECESQWPVQAIKITEPYHPFSLSPYLSRILQASNSKASLTHFYLGQSLFTISS